MLLPELSRLFKKETIASTEVVWQTPDTQDFSSLGAAEDYLTRCFQDRRRKPYYSYEIFGITIQTPAEENPYGLQPGLYINTDFADAEFESVPRLQNAYETVINDRLRRRGTLKDEDRLTVELTGIVNERNTAIVKLEFVENANG